MKKINTKQAFQTLYSAARAGEFGLYALRSNKLEKVIGEQSVYDIGEVITQILTAKEAQRKVLSLGSRLLLTPQEPRSNCWYH